MDLGAYQVMLWMAVAPVSGAVISFSFYSTSGAILSYPTVLPCVLYLCVFGKIIAARCGLVYGFIAPHVHAGSCMVHHVQLPVWIQLSASPQALSASAGCLA